MGPQLHRVEENIAAAGVLLTPDEVARLTDLSDSIELVGSRYPDFLERQASL